MNPQGRTFVGTGVEAFLLRLAGDGTQFYFFLSGENMQFVNRDPVSSEQTLIAVTQWKKEFLAPWQMAITGQYLYQDQVVDVSTTQNDLQTAKVHGNGLTLRSSVRRDFENQNWVELEMAGTEQYLRSEERRVGKECRL